MNYFIDNLQKYDYLNVNFNHEITNWLPFYWRGFNQSTRYTYIIDKSTDLNVLEKEFDPDIRRRRRKALDCGVKVFESGQVAKFYELNKKTFVRQDMTIPYGFEFVSKLYTVCKEYDACKIYLAEDDRGSVIAGSFLVYDENFVYYIMGGVDPASKKKGGMELVQLEGIKFALENKKSFDFEGSMIESIENYFKGFGAIQVPYFNINRYNSKLLKFREFIKRS